MTEKSLVESPAPSVGECKEVRSSDRALRHNRDTQRLNAKRAFRIGCFSVCKKGV